jgi:hypothetical protein
MSQVNNALLWTNIIILSEMAFSGNVSFGHFLTFSGFSGKDVNEDNVLLPTQAYFLEGVKRGSKAIFGFLGLARVPKMAFSCFQNVVIL